MAEAWRRHGSVCIASHRTQRTRRQAHNFTSTERKAVASAEHQTRNLTITNPMRYRYTNFVCNCASVFDHLLQNCVHQLNLQIFKKSTPLYSDTLVKTDFVWIKQRNGIVRIIRRCFTDWFCSDLSIFVQIKRFSGLSGVRELSGVDSIAIIDTGVKPFVLKRVHNIIHFPLYKHAKSYILYQQVEIEG